MTDDAGRRISRLIRIYLPSPVVGPLSSVVRPLPSGDVATRFARLLTDSNSPGSLIPSRRLWKDGAGEPAFAPP
jgi:hypothetical protein